jgi:hypothetical protein
MPGIETGAPERTETSSGRSASPKRAPAIFSTRARARRACATTAGEIRPPARENSAATLVAMVKPGGTGTPSRVISARLAPLPPSRSRCFALPSARPSPKK